MTTINFSDLEMAFLFVCAGPPQENNAYIDSESGKIFCVSELSEWDEEDVPADVSTSDRYIALPHKYDLDLGQALVMSFVNERFPDDAATVARFFRSRGAYRRFKEFLATRNALEQWQAFETEETKFALQRWCQKNNLTLDET